MLSKKDFYIGQDLFLVPSDRRETSQIRTVTSVGRKYIKFDDRGDVRIDISDSYFLEKRFYELKDYGVRGIFYFSKQEYLNKQELNKINNKLIQMINDGAIKNVSTAEKIEKILKEDSK